MKKEDVFQILGHITIFFSTLDIMTTKLILELVTEEYKSKNRPLNERATLKARFRLLQSLKDHDVKSVEAITVIREFLSEALEVAEERNRFMHDQWEFKEENLIEGFINRCKSVGLVEWKLKNEKVKYTIPELTALLNRIVKLQIMVGDILTKYGFSK